jgi:hypothetical protein
MTLQNIESNIQRDLGVGWRLAKQHRAKLFKKWKGYKEALQDLTCRYDDNGFIEFTLTINGKHKKVTL